MSENMNKNVMTNLALAVAGGVALRFAFSLHPVWWLAWLAPAPVLVAMLRSSRWQALGLAALASLIAASSRYHYATLLMPMPGALVMIVLLAFLWFAVFALARQAMAAPDASPWSVLAYPLLWCAADTLLAHLTPDTNFDSIAYSQAGFLPAVQILSLTGVAGLVFVLSLVPAVLALAIVRGWRPLRGPLVLAAVLTLATYTFGAARLAAGPAPAPLANPATANSGRVGLAVIDDFIGPRTKPGKVERIWAQYERHVETLAGQGASIVVLPEKIAVVPPAEAERLQERLSALAARTKAWLAVGIGTNDGQRKQNLEWLFAPDGRLDANYSKQHMAPPEREFAPGDAFDVRTIGSTRYGLAICKDMHFGNMGRAYGQRGAQVMLVPAWDFNDDGQYAARLSALRGVESGFAMVRAAREGLLTVTDQYGRIIAEAPSAAMPGATLLAPLPAAALPAPGDPAGPASATLYARTGDLVGWLGTLGAVLCLWPRRRRSVGTATAHTSA